MKISMDLRIVKKFEEESVREALLVVYERYGVKAPRELSLDVADYVRKLRQGLHSENFLLCQDLCLALFCGAQAMPALRFAVQSLPLASTIEELLTTLRNSANRRIRVTLFNRIRFFCSAFLSSRIGSLIFGNIWPFDPRCFARNIGGRFMTEKVFREGRPAFAIAWLVGATPTVGDCLSKEAVLAIRALNSVESIFPYGLWVYCNLQGTKLISEQKRSKELLKNSLENIDRFRVASLSVDNPWYRDRLGKKGDLLQHKAFVERELSVAVEGRLSWFAFALKDEERLEWRELAQFVVDKAFFLAQTRQDDAFSVFHELVILGLVRAWQAFCSRNSSTEVLSTIACKECADRGGNVNAALTWFLFEGSEGNRIKNVESILWGRPLLARFRLNEQRRTRGFLALARAFPRDKVKEFFDSVYQRAYGDVPVSYVVSVESPF